MKNHPKSKLPPLQHKNDMIEQFQHPNKLNRSHTALGKIEITEANLVQQIPKQNLPPPIVSAPVSTKEILVLASIVLLICGFTLLIVLPVYLIPIQYTVVVMGTNDLHGKVFPTMLFRQDTQQKYKYGGLVYMSNLMKIVQQQNAGNTIYLDAGDQFQGGIQSSSLVSSGEIMNDFFKQTNLQGSAVGNHQFDFGPDFLWNYMKGKPSPSLAANVLSQTDQPNFMPNQQGNNLFEFRNGIKIGVIGISTTQTPTTTATFINGTFPNYKFLPYKDVILKESKGLRERGANAIILVSHAGDSCNSDFTYGIRTSQTSTNACPRDEMTTLIDDLPQGTVDAVVQGHRHRIAHHYYKGIPYMGTINGGYYLNFMYLTFNYKKQLINSSIEGPVPVCQKVFENTKKCNYLTPEQLKTAGPLINWKFHDVDVTGDQYLNYTIQTKWSPKMSVFFEQIVKNQIVLAPLKDRQYELGNLFTNILHQIEPTTDFTILNTGGFRITWYPGIVDYQQYYNMFPFKNTIVTFTMTGTELINTMNMIQKGKEFFPTWGLKMEATIDSQLVRTLTSVKFANGTQIQPNTVYKGATIKYLLTGGDQFSKVIGTIYTVTNMITIGQFRATVKPYLINKQIIRSGQLIDNNNRRLIVNYI